MKRESPAERNQQKRFLSFVFDVKVGLVKVWLLFWYMIKQVVMVKVVLRVLSLI